GHHHGVCGGTRRAWAAGGLQDRRRRNVTRSTCSGSAPRDWGLGQVLGHCQLHAAICTSGQSREDSIWLCAGTPPCIFAARTPPNVLEGKTSGRDVPYVDNA